MGSKRDWNDMSDDSQQDEQNISLEEIQQITQANEPVQPPTLSKNISSPLPEKKPISNQEENLKRLENCLNQDIWLFNPIFYKNNVEEIDQIINQQQNFKKKEKFSKGWNVMVSKEYAQKLIIEGIKFEKFFLKFYFSNKNDQSSKRETNNDKRTKYIPKSPRNNRDYKSPTNLRKVVSQMEPQNGNKNFKNPSTSNTNYRDQLQRPVKTYKPKYIEKKPSQQQKAGQKLVHQNQEQLQSPKKFISKNQSSKGDKIKTFEKDNISSNTTSSEVQKKKKNKKKNSTHIDPNNPYTFF